MAPITKRLRENSNGEMKTNKGLDMSSILQLINERFKEQGEMIASKMSESEERILSVLHERLDGMSAEIQKLCVRVEKLERDVSEVDALKTQVGLLESKLSSLATAEVANDLRMHGVPILCDYSACRCDIAERQRQRPSATSHALATRNAIRPNGALGQHFKRQG
ncbi:hypothetical protein ACLKA6_017313 [Drosophila palustris]